MPQIEKLVLDGLYALLSAPATGFNAQYAAARPSYPSAEVVEIDWSPGVQGQAPQNIAKNFFLGDIEDGDLEHSGLQRFPAVCLFAGDLDGGPSDRRQKHMKFSGMVQAGLRWYIKHRDGIEQDNILDTVSCIRDAFLEVVNGNNATWPHGVVWNGDYKSAKPVKQLLGNGYVISMSSELTFEVHV